MPPDEHDPSRSPLPQWLGLALAVAVIVGAILLAQGRPVRRPSGDPSPEARSSSLQETRPQAPSSPEVGRPAGVERGQVGVPLASRDSTRLPGDLRDTLERIARGASLPFRDDGSVFFNREGLLPPKPAGYYHEYVHPTPGVRGPGAQRVITGRDGEVYYTPDHYRSFIQVDTNPGAYP